MDGPDEIVSQARRIIRIVPVARNSARCRVEPIEALGADPDRALPVLGECRDEITCQRAGIGRIVREAVERVRTGIVARQPVRRADP